MLETRAFAGIQVRMQIEDDYSEMLFTYLNKEQGLSCFLL